MNMAELAELPAGHKPESKPEADSGRSIQANVNRAVYIQRRIDELREHMKQADNNSEDLRKTMRLLDEYSGKRKQVANEFALKLYLNNL